MKKIIKNKNLLRYSFGFILGVILCGSAGVLASSYILKSSDIEYKANKSVQEAVEELYAMYDNESTGSNSLITIGTINAEGYKIEVPYTGDYTITTCVYGTNTNYGSIGTISNNKCTFTGTKSNQTLYYKIMATDSNGKMYETSGSATTGASGVTIVKENIPTGTKAIVYLDPTNLGTECNEQNSTSTTGTKSGCMKWYAYKETDDSYTMILDHNTTARGNSWSAASTQLASDTTGWTGNPRLITGQEVADITGNTRWTSTGSNFYFDTNCEPYDCDCEYDDNGDESCSSCYSCDYKYNNKYHWLFDYTKGCTIYGCKVADNTNYSVTYANRYIYGYWTSTSASSSDAWYVFNEGSLECARASTSNPGVRPVITISKSNL